MKRELQLLSELAPQISAPNTPFTYVERMACETLIFRVAKAAAELCNFKLHGLNRFVWLEFDDFCGSTDPHPACKIVLRAFELATIGKTLSQGHPYAIGGLKDAVATDFDAIKERFARSLSGFIFLAQSELISLRMSAGHCPPVNQGRFLPEKH